MKKSLQKLLPLLSAFFLGVIATTGLVQVVGAHGGNANFVHVCVKNSNGSIRHVGENDNCASGETALEWTKVPWNSDFPMMCQYCSLNNDSIDGVGNVFRNKDLSNAYLRSSTMRNVDFTDSILTNAHLIGTELINANFTNSVLSNTDFLDAQISSANFTGANATNAKFVAVNATNAIFTNSNLANVDFSSANLSAAADISTATRTGITWSNTTCPDGTNSDNNGNTCEGHLNP